jgi:transcriptional regulator with XRE-family HTH domain
MYEEPAICGKSGAGTVFFSGCNLGCVFCQNSVISRGSVGKEFDENELAELLNISREHLAKIETARRCVSLSLLFNLADVLSISEKDLFDFEEL